ncbi:MAG: gp26 family baseplate hub assembly chaperone [Methylophilaceae bacterium]
MPLPKIVTPTYSLEIPSIKKEIKYRPFLVKEEKILIIAMESEDPKQIAEALKTVIGNCIITRGIKVDQLSIFDIEYIFLNVRGKSVGEDVDVLLTCPDDGTTQVPVTINLDDISVVVKPEHSKDIKLDDNLKLRMKYPSMKEFIKNNFSNDGGMDVDDTFEMIVSCIDQIYSEEESWPASDSTKKELEEFLEQLTSQQFKEIEKFFNTMPKLSHTISIKNPNTGIESDITLEGLTSFFA